MYPNNGSGSSGGLPHNLHQENRSSVSGGQESGQYLSRHPNLTLQEDSSGESLNGFAEDAAFNDPGSFYQNQQIVNPLTQFSPSPFLSHQIVAPVPSRPTSINARAAELKQQLLRSREARASSSTPASHTGIPGLAAENNPKAQPIGSVRQSSQPQMPTISHEDDISALISQLAPAPESAPAEPNARPGYNQVLHTPLPERPQTDLLPLQSAGTSLGNTRKAARSPNTGDVAAKSAFTRLDQTNNFHGSPSELSDGEIPEETVTKSTDPSVQKANEEAPITKAKSAESATPPLVQSDASGGNRPQKPFQNSHNRGSPEGGRGYRPSVSDQQTPSQFEAPQSGTDRRENASELPLDQRVQLSDHKHASQDHSNSNHRLRNGNNSGVQDRREFQLVREQQLQTRKPDPRLAVDTLEQVLLQNADLREWLVHTGYYNIPYRNKILNARREIAALDAKRERLFAELMAEERHGFPFALAPSTLPSLLSNKADNSNEISLTLATEVPDAYQEPIINNKRPFSDIQDTHNEHNLEKAPRFDDGGPTRRIREEGEPSRGRPISRENDTGPRISPDYRADREPDRPQYDDFRFHEEARMRDRDSSRDRDFFPGPRGYDSRGPERSRSYDRESLRDFDTDMSSRAFERRGSYRSRGFDPSYRGGRGRGRGRGRGDF